MCVALSLRLCDSPSTLHPAHRSKLLAGNPFGDVGGRYLADVLGKTNNSLRVLDIHNSEMSSSVEQDIVDYLRSNSVLNLLGSHFGRRDHRIVHISGEANKNERHSKHNRDQVGPAVQAWQEQSVPSNMRGHEVF